MMIRNLIFTFLFLVVLMVAWSIVQAYWKRTFAENITDEDALAERRSCANCGCTTVCSKSKNIEYEEDLI